MSVRYCRLAMVALALLIAPANAQVPGTAEPGRVEQRFEPPPTPKSVPEIAVPPPEEQPVPDEAKEIRFQLTQVVIEGSTVYDDSDLAVLYKHLLGKEVSLAQIYELRDAITSKYRGDGYILSQAIIPPQKISGGSVRLQVIEGYVENVIIRGDAEDRRGLIARMGKKIAADRPLRVSTLERYVLLASDIPGVTLRTVLSPTADKPGAADLTIIIEHDSADGFVAVDNRGSKAIGPVQGQLGINFNSVLGLDERTSVFFATTAQTRELQYGSVDSDWILDAEGTRLNLFASYSHTKPSGALAVLDPIGNGWTGHLSFTKAIVRSRVSNLTLSASVGFRNTKTDLLGAPFSEDRVRNVSASVTYDTSDVAFGATSPATTLLTAELSQGINVFDATEPGSANLSRANGASDFTKLFVEATRLQQLRGPLSVALTASAQLSGTPLLSAEQFGLGGTRFGRGYEPSELTGDQGISGSAELRYAEAFGIEGSQLYTFYDVGTIQNRAPPLGTPKTASLSSAGTGIRLTLIGFSVNAELAKPLTRDVASRGNKSIRLLFGVSTRF